MIIIINNHLMAQMDVPTDSKLHYQEWTNAISSLPPICHCTYCFCYLGESNPRQFCRKTHCEQEGETSELLFLARLENLMHSPYKTKESYEERFDYAINIGKKILNNMEGL